MSLRLYKGPYRPGNLTSEDELSLTVCVGAHSLTIGKLQAKINCCFWTHFHVGVRKGCYGDTDGPGGIKMNKNTRREQTRKVCGFSLFLSSLFVDCLLLVEANEELASKEEKCLPSFVLIYNHKAEY